MNKPAATACDHPVYPEYEAEYGEDPARFLYHLEPTARISGIDNPGLLRAYLDVETDRDTPRRDVIAACNQRLTQVSQAESGEEGAVQPAVATDGGERR